MLYNNKQENTILDITLWSMISFTHTHTHDPKQSTTLLHTLLIMAGAPEKRNAPKLSTVFGSLVIGSKTLEFNIYKLCRVIM